MGPHVARAVRRTRARGDCSTSRRAAIASTARCGPRRRSATGGSGNSNALVGTPETVAAALMDYVHLGVDILSARGYDTLEDAAEFGRYVIPDRAGRGRAARPGYGARLGDGPRAAVRRGHEPRVEHRVEVAELRFEDVEARGVGIDAPSSTSTGRRWTSTASAWSGAAPTITGTTVTAAS